MPPTNTSKQASEIDSEVYITGTPDEFHLPPYVEAPSPENASLAY